MYYKQLLTLLCGCALFACQDKNELDSPAFTKFSLRDEVLSANNQLDPINVYAYKDKQLAKKFEKLQPEGDLLPVNLEPGIADRLIVLAGDNSEHLQYALNDLREIKTEATMPVDFNSTYPHEFFSGEKDLMSATKAITDIELVRSVASLDFKLGTSLPVHIDSCVIDDLADKTNFFSDCPTPPHDLTYRTMRLPASAFSELKNSQQRVALMYESHGKAPAVTIYAKINDVKTVMNINLPKNIERNKRYEVVINSNGAVLFANLQVLPWGDGGSTEAKPDGLSPKIDLSKSEFPQGITPSQSLDTLYISPDFSGKFILGIDAPVETETKVDNPHIQIEQLSATKSTYLGNQFELEVTKSNINQPDLMISMYVKSKMESQYYDKQIILAKKGFRTRFNNCTAEILGDHASFAEYTDGDLASVTSSSEFPIQSISTRSVDDQFNWLRVSESGQSRILEGGFKPNDQEATGQKQSSTISVRYTDGKMEEFTFSRKRNSIPVTKIGGKYWAKFNMRGNSKSYDDQISFNKDINNLWEYLKTCSDNDYLYYAGHEYKGVSPEGMHLTNQNGNLIYNKYNTIPDGNLSSAPSTTHCPGGYKIPTKNELSQLIATNVRLRLPQNGSSDHYTVNSTGKRYKIERFKRESISVEGIKTPAVYHMKITEVETNESIILNGFGHQFSSSKISFGYWLFGLVETGGYYYSIDNSRNHMEMQKHNHIKTRIIRCVKTPVNFVIQ